MKLVTALIVILMGVNPLFTQQFGNINMPIVGDSIAIKMNNEMSDFAPGEGGDGVTWDFTGTSYPDDEFFNFRNIEEAEHKDRFSDATIYAYSNTGAEAYYSSLMDEIVQVGLVFPVDNEAVTYEYLFIDYSDPYKIIDLPISYGDSLPVNYKATYKSDDDLLSFDFVGAGYVKVDGRGTLITPTGTFEDVLRIHTVVTETGQFINNSIDQYVYASADFRFWIALFEKRELVGDVNIQKWYSLNSPVVSPASVTTDNKMVDVQIYPNPTKNNLRINSVELFDGFEIYDSMGRLVMDKTISNTNTYSVDIATLRTGVYNIVLSTNGSITTTKFVKE